MTRTIEEIISTSSMSFPIYISIIVDYTISQSIDCIPWNVSSVELIFLSLIHISTKELSGGVKTLMLMAFDDSGKIFNASACGDNCAKWILRIAGKKNLTINLHHIMDFGKDFEAKILNTGEIVHSMAEFISVAGKYV